MQSINSNLESSQGNSISISPNSHSSVTALLYPHHSSNENYHLYQHNHNVSNMQTNLSHYHSSSNIGALNNSNNNHLSARSHVIFPNSSSPSNIQQHNASIQNSNSKIMITFQMLFLRIFCRFILYITYNIQYCYLLYLLQLEIFLFMLILVLIALYSTSSII